ncbi:NPCBM/NEW2 domain-containing protein [Lentzea terrae]|uniref:NPCBM/NEW2 domain-containing protein n=1 Tax=Lentzea terrae TaxID=2200761 RepID=UPI000DD387A5|nr:NPCBM/NEW2 domain-containing protein [Lentzea terrae]
MKGELAWGRIASHIFGLNRHTVASMPQRASVRHSLARRCVAAILGVELAMHVNRPCSQEAHDRSEKGDAAENYLTRKWERRYSWAAAIVAAVMFPLAAAGWSFQLYYQSQLVQMDASLGSSGPHSEEYLGDLSPSAGSRLVSEFVTFSDLPLKDFLVARLADNCLDVNFTEYDLGGKFSSFSAVVGVTDHSADAQTTVEVKLLVDARPVETVLVSRESAALVRADVAAVKRLTIQWRQVQPAVCGANYLAFGNAGLGL